MTKADCFQLGYIAKLHGFKGEVSLFLDVTNPNDYINLDVIYIDINNQLTPFFITSFRLKNKGFASVKLEGIDDETAAKKLLRKSVYLPENLLPELDGDEFYDHEVIGYKVIDENHGEIGVVNDVFDNAVNPLFQILKGDVEILLPIQDEIIQQIDKENRTIHVKAPTGLIELYLS